MKKFFDFFNTAGALLSRCIRRNARFVICISIAAFVFLLFKINSYTENVNRGISENLIRLHVVANSDSPEDQELKCIVRDKILAYIRNEVKTRRASNRHEPPFAKNTRNHEHCKGNHSCRWIQLQC